MAISNATTSTTLTNAINSEAIQAVIREYQRAPSTAMLLADLIDMSSQESTVATVLKHASLSAASQAAETDSLSASAMSFSQVQLTQGTVAVRHALSYQARINFMRAPAEILGQQARSIRDQIDSDYHSASTSATDTSADYSGNSLTNQRFITAAGAFKEKNPVASMGQRMAFVVHPHSLTEWLSDLAYNGGSMYGAEALGGQAAGLADAGTLGFKTRFHGFEIWESSNVPQADASNWHNYLATVGQGGAMSLAVWKQFDVRVGDAVNELADNIVAHAMYAAKITDDNSITPVITSKS